MDRTAWKTDLLMIGVAAIWGSTFVAQQLGMNSVGPFTYTAARMVLGVALIAPLWWWRGCPFAAIARVASTGLWRDGRSGTPCRRWRSVPLRQHTLPLSTAVKGFCCHRRMVGAGRGYRLARLEWSGADRSGYVARAVGQTVLCRVRRSTAGHRGASACENFGFSHTTSGAKEIAPWKPNESTLCPIACRICYSA